MQYDGKNTRLLMSYGGKTTSYLQDGAAGLPVVLQETVSGQPSSSFMYPLGSTSPLFQSDGSGTGLWYNKDGLGSVRALTNSSGVVTSTNSYSAFGLNAGETGKAGNTHGFAGEQLDPTGLYFNRARYFSPSLGRFIGRDDIGEGSSSRYAYTSNNPLAYIDPTGNYQYAGDGGIDSRPVDQAPHGGDTTDFLDDLLHYDPCKGKTGIEFQFCRIPPPNPLPYVLPQTKPTTQIDLTPVIDPDLFGFKRKGGLQTGLEIALCLAILFPVSNPSINKKDKNRGTIQIQGTDITQSNKGAVKDTGNNGWMLSWSWDRYSPISVKRAMKELADLLDALTEKQQTRRRKAYNKATVYISSIKVAGEHVSYPGDPGLSDKFKGVRIDVAVYEGRAFDVDSVLGE